MQRLNDHHAHELLEVARAFGGEAHALSARATSVDDDGVDLIIETADGRTTSAHVPFAVATGGPRRRLAFRELTQRASDQLRRDPSEGTTQ